MTNLNVCTQYIFAPATYFKASTIPHELLFKIFSLLSHPLATASPSETTAMKVQTTTTSTVTHTTTVYQKPSTHTNSDIIANEYEKTASSTTVTMDILPWILMGTMTVLFLGLLTANVICCTVYALNSKKKRYTLKRNPSYLPTSRRPVNAHNCGFENHIYDVPTT